MGIKFGFSDKIAPRLGFAYDLKGDGKWKAYGSFGHYYDITEVRCRAARWAASSGTTTTGRSTPQLEERQLPGRAAPAARARFIEESTPRFGSNEPDNPETAGVMTK